MPSRNDAKVPAGARIVGPDPGERDGARAGTFSEVRGRPAIHREGRTLATTAALRESSGAGCTPETNGSSSQSTASSPNRDRSWGPSAERSSARMGRSRTSNPPKSMRSFPERESRVEESSARTEAHRSGPITAGIR